MAQEISDDFMAMQEDNIAYFTSLEPESYMAADREMQFALQVGDRLVRVMKYFHPTSDVTKALEDRLTDMESRWSPTSATLWTWAISHSERPIL